MAEEFQTSSYADIKNYENEFADEVESTYADTSKFKNRPFTDELQTPFTDAVKYENKPDGEFDTTSQDIGNYKNKPADEFQATDTDTKNCKNMLQDVEFQTAHDNNTGEFGNESKLGGENQTTFEDGENYISNPLERDQEKNRSLFLHHKEDENYKPIDEKKLSTFITGEEGENNPISAYGDSTSDSIAIVTDQAKSNYEKEDENSQFNVSEGDGMTIGYNDSLTESEAKHDYEEEGGCALHEKKSSEKDSEDADSHKLEEEDATKTVAEDVGYAFHDKKEADQEDDEAHVKKKTFYIF